MTLATPGYRIFNNSSFGSPMPDRTFVPEACSTQTVVQSAYTYQDNFQNPAPLWNPVGGAVVGWAGPRAMTVNCNIPNEGVQQVLPCIPGIQNTLDLTLTYGNNDIQIMLLDPLTMLPLPGYPMLFPSTGAGNIFNIQLFFIGPPNGNVIVQITSPGGLFPYPDMFIVNYAAISTQTTTQPQVCWNEDYRFGFNGMEKDNEAKGQGNSLNFGARIYDSRLGRFLSCDRFFRKYPYQSNYVFASNMPICAIDFNGDSTYVVVYGAGYLNPNEKGNKYDVGDGFKKSAEARVKEIKSRPGYDETRDEVILVFATTEDEFIQAVNKNYPSGKIAELDVYSHGSTESINLGGNTTANPSNPAEREYRLVSVPTPATYFNDGNPDGNNEFALIDGSNFEDKAIVNLWGCNMGKECGLEGGGTIPAPAQEMVNALGGDQRVNAFNSYSQFKTVEKQNNGTPVYDGEMIRDKDANTNKVNQTTFKKDTP